MGLYNQKELTGLVVLQETREENDMEYKKAIIKLLNAIAGARNG